jgi:hypothetical protein
LTAVYLLNVEFQAGANLKEVEKLVSRCRWAGSGVGTQRTQPASNTQYAILEVNDSEIEVVAEKPS